MAIRKTMMLENIQCDVCGKDLMPSLFDLSQSCFDRCVFVTFRCEDEIKHFPDTLEEVV